MNCYIINYLITITNLSVCLVSIYTYIAMVLLLLLRNIIFIIFFSAIGMRFLSFIPIVVGLILFLYMSDQETSELMSKEQVTSFFTRHAFAFARSCIMLGGWGIADVLGGSLRMVSLRLVGINIVLRLASYVIDYEDGQEMFHIGYRVASFVAIGTAYELLDDV